MQISEEFYSALEDKLLFILEDAGKRAEENRRKTVKPYDIPRMGKLGSKEGFHIVKKSGIRKTLIRQDYHVAEDTYGAVDRFSLHLLSKARRRAENEGVKTLHPRHI